MSYLIIENMKLVVEISEEDIEPFEKKALDEITSKENTDEFDIDIDETDVSDLTFKEAFVLYKAHNIIQTLIGIKVDKMFLYWLDNRDIEYSIESYIDVSRYQRDGYIIL